MKIDIGDNIATVTAIVAIVFSLAYCIPQIGTNNKYKKCFIEETKDYPICYQKENK